MVFNRRRTPNPPLLLIFKNIIIEQIGHNFEDKSFKFLGFLIDKKLKFNYHIEKVANKMWKGINGLNEAQHCLSMKTRKIIYGAMVHSHLTYGTEIWYNHANKKDINTLLLLQKRAIRTLLNVDRLSHTEPLFKQLQVLSLTNSNYYSNLP